MNVSWVPVMISAHALCSSSSSYYFLLEEPHYLRERGRAAERETVFLLFLHLSGSVYTELLLKVGAVCVWDDKAFARRLLHCFSCVFARVKLSSPPSDSLASFHAIWGNLLCLSFLERKGETKQHEYKRWEIACVFERDVNTDERSDKLQALVYHGKWSLSLYFRAGQH